MHEEGTARHRVKARVCQAGQSSRKASVAGESELEEAGYRV